jgi:hypothetical protein
MSQLLNPLRLPCLVQVALSALVACAVFAFGVLG